MNSAELFIKLNEINVNSKTEKKNDLTYLSWTYAVQEISKKCSDFMYDIEMFPDKDGVLKPYTYDELLGYMVYTHVTINGTTKRMWLPVQDSHNLSMKDHPYKVKFKTYEVEVAPASMNDINKSLMRCLVKNIAMFGLGLYIYAGEDMPTSEREEQSKERWEGLEK